MGPQSNMTSILIRQLCEDRNTQEPCDDKDKDWKNARTTGKPQQKSKVGPLLRVKIIKLLEENTGVNLHGLRFGYGFLNLMQKHSDINNNK